jgi:hypothetical protein
MSGAQSGVDQQPAGTSRPSETVEGVPLTWTRRRCTQNGTISAMRAEFQILHDPFSGCQVTSRVAGTSGYPDYYVLCIFIASQETRMLLKPHRRLAAPKYQVRAGGMFVCFWKTAVPAPSNAVASHEVTEAFHLPRHSAPTRYSNSHAFANKAWPSIPWISSRDQARRVTGNHPATRPLLERSPLLYPRYRQPCEPAPDSNPSQSLPWAAVRHSLLW